MIPIADVEAFHKKFGFPVNGDLGVDSEFRQMLDTEETKEFWEAVENGDRHKAALELADRLFVLLGDAIQFGLNLQRAWNAVIISNMLKEPNPEGGKPIKPDDWISPEELYKGIVCAK